MVNDFNDTQHKQPKFALQTSKTPKHLNDNPLEDFPDYQNSINNPTGITSPPSFYTKRPNRLQMTRLKIQLSFLTCDTLQN